MMKRVIESDIGLSIVSLRVTSLLSFAAQVQVSEDRSLRRTPHSVLPQTVCHSLEDLSLLHFEQFGFPVMANLAELPAELLIDIVHSCSHTDIKHLSETCRLLHNKLVQLTSANNSTCSSNQVPSYLSFFATLI